MAFMEEKESAGIALDSFEWAWEIFLFYAEQG